MLILPSGSKIAHFTSASRSHPQRIGDDLGDQQQGDQLDRGQLPELAFAEYAHAEDDEGVDGGDSNDGFHGGSRKDHGRESDAGERASTSLDDEISAMPAALHGLQEHDHPPRSPGRDVAEAKDIRVGRQLARPWHRGGYRKRIQILRVDRERDVSHRGLSRVADHDVERLLLAIADPVRVAHANIGGPGRRAGLAPGRTEHAGQPERRDEHHDRHADELESIDPYASLYRGRLEERL